MDEEIARLLAVAAAVAASYGKVFGRYQYQIVEWVIEAGEIDEVHAFLAPKLISGIGTPSPLTSTGIADMEDALRLESLRCQVLGEDVYISGRVVRPAESAL